MGPLPQKLSVPGTERVNTIQTVGDQPPPEWGINKHDHG